MDFSRRFPDFADIDIDGDSPAAARPNGHAGAAPQAPSPEAIATIDWPSLEGQWPPKREFIVEHWLATGYVTSLYAPGGFGKSLLAQLLGSCVSARRLFLGLETMQAPVLAIFCEDDEPELWRRQCRINEAMDLKMRDLGGFAAQGRMGMPNLLMAFTKGKPPAALPLLEDIETKARAIGVKLVILDNAAQLFGGEENSRAEVTTFINALNGMARRLGAAVLMLGHPPKSGAEYSGSTAWHSVVRCMWTLARAVEKDEDGEGSDVMVLTRTKANYAPGGEELRLRWVDGVLRREESNEPASAMDASYHRHNAKMVFLAALDELTAQQRSVSHSDRAGNFAPKMMKAAGLAADFTKADLKRAMEGLFADQSIVANAQLWRGADRKWVVGLARRNPADPPPVEDGVDLN